MLKINLSKDLDDKAILNTMNKAQLQSIVKEELANVLAEGNTHPFVLRAMEELKDDLDFYLANKNKIDIDLLKKKMSELAKLIKQYSS